MVEYCVQYTLVSFAPLFAAKLLCEGAAMDAETCSTAWQLRNTVARVGGIRLCRATVTMADVDGFFDCSDV